MPETSPLDDLAAALAAHVFIKSHTASLGGPHIAHDPHAAPRPVVLSCTCGAPLVRFTLPERCECGHPRVDAGEGGHAAFKAAVPEAGGCQAAIATEPRIVVGADGKRRAVAEVEDCPCKVFTWRPPPDELRDTYAQELWEDHVGVKVGIHALESIRGGQEDGRWYADAECGCRHRERVYGDTPPDPQTAIRRWAEHVAHVLAPEA